MITNDEIREALENPHLTDAEVEEFREALHLFIRQILDAYFRGELEQGD